MVAKGKVSKTRKKAPRARGLTDRRKASRRSSARQHVSEAMQVRVLLAVFCVAISFTLMGGRMVWLSMVSQGEPQTKHYGMRAEVPVRGDIYDRNGVLMATSLKAHSVYADPKMMLDAKEAVAKLAPIFPQMDAEKMEDRLSNKKRRFVWLKRHITPAQVKQVNDLGIPGVHFREEIVRLYPQGVLASHTLGAMNMDGKGVAGVEASYDEALRKGEDIHLTLDVRLQQQLRKSLVEAYDASDAKGVWGVVMDPDTGDVLAMSSLPDYDPNHFGDAQKEAWMNRVASGTFEMGSTFKIFTLAQGFDRNLITESSMLDCREPIKIGGFRINDFHAKKKWMTAKEVFQYSSNIGAARIADTFGDGEQRAFFDKLHLLSPIDTGLIEQSTPIYPQRRWGRIHTMSMSYGHGIAVSPMHMVAAVGAVVNDGYYRAPNVVKHAVREAPRQVVRPETVGYMREMMRTVVEEGTGRRAGVAGYDIGGKTGTAEKNVDGRYVRHKNISSFVGAVPLENPQFVGLIMVDEGKIGGSSGGGAVAAPAFKAFVQRAAPIVGLVPQTGDALLAAHQNNVKQVSYREIFSVDRTDR